MSLLESQLAMLWAELLGVPVSDIGVADNFFDLGGSSLLAMRFVEQAGRRLGVRIEPQRVVASTLRQVAERAEAVEDAGVGRQAKGAGPVRVCSHASSVVAGVDRGVMRER